jgi:molybdopterin biosynthesis enzyme
VVQPLLFSMQGTTLTEFKEIVPLARSISSNHGREEFIPVRMKMERRIPLPANRADHYAFRCGWVYPRPARL